MNSEKIDHFLISRLRYFDGVFSVENLPEDPHLLVCNTDPSGKPNPVVIGSLSTSRMRAKTFSTLLDVNLMLILNVM